ncbi:Glycosyltransferase [Rhynchospora pubera]|uniref:Glycosyltransferase n=1 Tax=Rhynchospora pubera TaxID=906938 RepID=A0AAV8FW29_9POAL|nr:Glycosyltransferase [Rhynchospora pubera]
MISLPHYAEQHMNTVMLSEGIGIALRPKESEDGIVERGEVARVVRDLMEGVNGKRMRSKVKELQGAASSALAVGGASYQALEEVENKWKKNALVSE